ncbi:hypothetical protein LTZ17_08255 [Lacticaseibacillus casei]|nr:hypothetical protein [Lacticaseibacillus casei]
MDADQCADLVKMMKKGIKGLFLIFAFLVNSQPGQVAASATFETEARVQIVVDASDLHDETLPLPDFKPQQLMSAKMTESGSPLSRADSGNERYLPNLNELIKNGLMVWGSGILLIASLMFGRKKGTDRLTLKKG